MEISCEILPWVSLLCSELPPTDYPHSSDIRRCVLRAAPSQSPNEGMSQAIKRSHFEGQLAGAQAVAEELVAIQLLR